MSTTHYHLQSPEELASLDGITSTLGMGLLLIDRQMNIVWANQLIRDVRKRKSLSQKGHCFDVWLRRDRCQDCLPLLVFRTGKAQVGLRERGGFEGPTQTYQVRAIPVLDASGKQRWVMESLVQLDALVRTTSPGWSDRRLLELASSSAGAFMVVDSQDRIVSWSPSAAAMFGYDQDQVLGRSVDLLLPRDRLEDKARIRRLIEGQGLVEKLETFRQAKDGRRIPVLISARTLVDEKGRYVGRSTIVEDLSPLKELRSQLEAQEQLLTYVTREAGDAILGLSTDGKIESWSRGSETMFGYSFPEIIGQPLSRLAGEEQVSALLVHLVQKGSVRGLRMQWRHNTGREVPVEVTGTLLRNREGEVAGWGLAVRDISEAQRKERQMMRSVKLAAVGSLTAGLAHEIGTPLNVISATAEYLLADIPGKGSMVEELRGIVAETERISKLVHELLTFARGPSSGWTLIDPREVIERVCRLVRIPMERKGVTLDLKLADGIPLFRSEQDGLHQVLLNLLLNALRVVSNGGQILVNTHWEPQPGPGQEGVLILKVADDGPGVPDDLRERVFDPFFTTHPDGTGLGLAVCARIVATHGGDIRVVDSELGGSCFIVYLPSTVEDLL